jgi:hypothetical protein
MKKLVSFTFPKAGLLSATVAAAVLVLSVASCTKSAAPDPVADLNLTSEEVSLVRAAGFNGGWAEKTTDGNYLVEGDILLTKDQLQKLASSTPTHNFIIASEEHYRTTELVNTNGGIRTITVSLGSGFPAHYSTGLDQALARYNSYNLNIRFQRVASGGEIQITGAKLGSTIGGGCILGQSAGFPTGGNPAPGFKLSTSRCATTYLNTADAADEVMAHELGHTIGFRHTDYVNRASCGSTSGETAGTMGAIWISGTPTTVAGNYNSWMMACTNGSPLFNAEDGIALTTVY